jgi:hypothetical protein
MKLFNKRGLTNREAHGARNKLSTIAHLLADPHSAYRHGLLHPNYQTLSLEEEFPDINRRFAKEMDQTEFVSRRAKIDAPPTEEKPIGEIVESAQAKEKEEFQRDLEENGSIDFSQPSAKGPIDKLKNIFNKNKIAPPAGNLPAQPIAQPQNMPQQMGGIIPSAEITKMQMALEKVNAELFAVKDKNQFFGDRLQKLSEDIGEIRSMQFQKDKQFGDVQAAAEKAAHITDMLDPQRIQKIMEQRKREIEELYDKFERADEISKRAQQEIEGVREALTQITSMKNLLKETENLAKVGREVKKMREESRSYAEQAQAAYIEVRNVITEISTISAQIETNSEISKDSQKQLDRINLLMENVTSKADVDKLRSTVNKLLRYDEKMSGIEGELKNTQEQVSNILAIKAPAAANIDIRNKDSEIKALQEQRKQIEYFLEDLKEDFNARVITESAFAEARNMNEARLTEIDKKLSLLQMELEKVEEKSKYTQKNTPQQQSTTEPLPTTPNPPTTMETPPAQQPAQPTEVVEKPLLEESTQENPLEKVPGTTVPVETSPTEAPNDELADLETPPKQEPTASNTSLDALLEQGGEKKANNNAKETAEKPTEKASSEDDLDLESLDIGNEKETEKPEGGQPKTNSDEPKKVPEEELDLEDLDVGEKTEAKPVAEEDDELIPETKTVEKIDPNSKGKTAEEPTKSPDLSSADLEQLRKHRNKYNKFLEQIRQQYDSDLMSESEFYATENRTMGKLKEINEQISKKIDHKIKNAE